MFLPGDEFLKRREQIEWAAEDEVHRMADASARQSRSPSWSLASWVIAGWCVEIFDIIVIP
jgi:hypothetical protein